MKAYIWIILSSILVLTSCNRNDDFYPYDEDDQEYFDDYDDYDDGNDNGGGTDNGGSGGDEGSLSLYKVNNNEISLIQDFNVSSNLQSFQNDKGKHQQMWDFVTTLIPLEERDKIAEFEVFHGQGDLLGYVQPLNDNDLSQWKFALAIDAATNLNTIDFSDFFTFVTIHEYGHVLTLNDEQINVGGREGSCANYFTGEGCSTSTSYINELYELGWSDIINSHNQDNPDATYNKYKDRFVSDYAATNPGEDIAEVFSFFVINNSAPTGNTIADQKIKLMYNYPELVQLRDDIRSNGNVARMNAKSTSKALGSFKMRCKNGCTHDLF